MDFQFGSSKTYTNTITRSVGPTTSLTTRALVDTDSGHFVYLDAVNGDDSDSGFSPGLAKKTIDAAYGAMTGVRQVIHILDSSTYTPSTTMTFTAAAKSGIQAALGAAPIINLTGSNSIQMTDVGDGKFLSGLIIVSSSDGVLAGPVFANTDSGAVITITDCLIYDFRTGLESISLLFQSLYSLYLAGASANTGSITVTNNIIYTKNGLGCIYAATGTAADKVNITSNIMYQNADYRGGEDRYDIYFASGAGYASYTVNIDSSQKTATLTSGSMVPGEWSGYYTHRTYPYRIRDNSDTVLFLEDVYGYGISDGSSVSIKIHNLYKQNAIDIKGYQNSYANITKNIIYSNGHKAGIGFESVLSSGTNQLTAEGNVIFGARYGLAIVRAITSAGTSYASILGVENICYTTYDSGVIMYWGGDSSTDTGMSISSDVIDNSTVPLYFNQQRGLDPRLISPFVDSQTGYVQAAYDFRLRQKGKKYYDTDNQGMIIDSPLLGLYTVPDPDEDLCPWEETISEGGIVYADEISIEYPAKSLNAKYLPINPVMLDDLHGNMKLDWDAWRLEWTFNFQDYTGNENIWRMYYLFRDKKAKKFYPIGVGQTLMPDSTNGSIVGVSSTEATFTPDPIGTDFVPHHWKGAWITIDDGGTLKDYYIYDSDELTLTLYDKLGNGFPTDGHYNFTIEYYLVQARLNGLAFTQDRFTDFTCGGAWQEKNGVVGFEYTNPTLTLVEVENPL